MPIASLMHRAIQTVLFVLCWMQGPVARFPSFPEPPCSRTLQVGVQPWSWWGQCHADLGPEQAAPPQTVAGQVRREAGLKGWAAPAGRGMLKPLADCSWSGCS